MILIYVMGATNVGKSTFLQQAKRLYQDKAHLVEVGKALRAKYLNPKSPHYDPDYFKGSAAPAHTAAEAWQLMCDGVGAAIAGGAQLCLVDGQPRDMQQARESISVFSKKHLHRFWFHLWQPYDVRLGRARDRDKDDPAKLKLSLQRMNNDPPQLYEVVSYLRTSMAAELVHDTKEPMATLAYVQRTLRHMRGIDWTKQPVDFPEDEL